MKEQDENMESRILACAENLFLSKGYNLASMTEIAKEAGCTQALVHYYFRTKENLFSKIFDEKLHMFLNSIVNEEDERLPFGEMLAVRASRLFDIMAANPRLPFMFMSEFMINPNQRMNIKDSVMSACSGAVARLDTMIRAEVERGNIRNTDTTSIVLNMFSLVVTFFIFLPFLEEAGIVDDGNRSRFLEERKAEIIETLIGSLRP